jgi:hypothetical protein
MADATLRGLSADTDIGATDVIPKQGTTGNLKKITGTNFGAVFESGGALSLSLAADQVAAAGADTRLQYNNGAARGGDAEITWDNSGKVLTVGAVTATTQLKTKNLSFGDGDTLITDAGTNTLSFRVTSSEPLIFTKQLATTIPNRGLAAKGPALVNKDASVTTPTILPSGDDDDTGIGLSSSDKLSLIAGGKRMLAAIESTQDHVAILAEPLPAGMLGWFSRIAPKSFTTMVIDEDNDQLEFWVNYADGKTTKSGAVGLS